MTLIVELGYGTIGAEAYSSVAETDAFWTSRGGNARWTAATVPQKEVALRLVADFLDTQGLAGSDPYVDGQGLAFPFDGDMPTLAAVQRLKRTSMTLAPIALDGPFLGRAPSEPTVLSRTEKIGDLSESTTWADSSGSGTLDWNGTEVGWVSDVVASLTGRSGIVLGTRSRA